MNSRTPRGSALLVTVIVVLVCTVTGISLLRFTRREVAGAIAGEHEQALVACAEAARVQLLAQFHVLGFNPSQLQALNVNLGTTGTSLTQAVGGHYDTPSGGVVIEQVTYLPDTVTGPSATPRDLTNTSSLLGQGGRPVKVVVMCKDGVGGGRQLEVEFGLRFGL